MFPDADALYPHMGMVLLAKLPDTQVWLSGKVTVDASLKNDAGYSSLNGGLITPGKELERFLQLQRHSLKPQKNALFKISIFP